MVDDVLAARENVTGIPTDLDVLLEQRIHEALGTLDLGNRNLALEERLATLVCCTEVLQPADLAPAVDLGGLAELDLLDDVLVAGGIDGRDSYGAHRRSYSFFVQRRYGPLVNWEPTFPFGDRFLLFLRGSNKAQCRGTSVSVKEGHIFDRS